MVTFNIEQTNDYEGLVKFFIENELEFSADDPIASDIVQCWRVMGEMANNGSAQGSTQDEAAPEHPVIIGGITLAKRQGEFIVDGIAVDEAYRTHKLGKALLDTLIEEVKRLAGTRIYLVARAPGFFRRQGFATVPMDEETPNFYECLTCPQRGVSCHPEVMKMTL